ncbi:enterochelin esterase family protein [Azospirillum fermentarium]|uniref:enterochelin esterase n=1 Tax=Azospirillum fermentarium TaxID=1233114 RepID=UPI002226E76E|nr:enterochelin esterase [Azospirillum fermentarium]MCW2246591.1 enterochelin esterase family protein [Azospirillum fermentarium]
MTVLSQPLAAPAVETDQPFTADPGDYVEGVMDTTAHADLSLVDGQGRAVRRLLTRSVGRDSFRFVAEPGVTHFRIRAEGAATVTITRRVGAGQQIAPPAVPLSPTIAAMAAALERGEGTDGFWQRMAEAGTPLVEPLKPGTVILTFLQRGAQRNVRLLGGPTADHEMLERLGTSDIWYKSFTVPDGTRLAYKLAPDVPDFPGTCRECRMAILSQAQADPLNRHPWPDDAPDRFSRWSGVDLPAAPPMPGVGVPPAPVPGTVAVHRFASARLGNTRDVAIYTPPGFDPLTRDTVLLVLFDGDDYRTQVPTPAILDHLTGTGRLPPVVAVFVGNVDATSRARELPANPDFAAMLADELVPWVAAKTGLSPRPERTVLGGSSYGGLAAVTAALEYPQRFGNALSISGSFWWHPAGTPPERANIVAAWAAERERQPVRFFLSAGLFENGTPDDIGIRDANRHLRDVLAAKGYDVTHREYAAGHDYYSWRGVLGDGLLALFGRPSPPRSFSLTLPPAAGRQ